MLEEIEGYMPQAEYRLLSFIEEVLTKLYEYETHHTSLVGLVTDLQDSNDVNTFYRDAISLYSLVVNNLYSILGLEIEKDVTLLSKTELLKALIDVNNKETGLKEEAYDKLENYDNNVDKLIHILKTTHAMSDPIILNDIFKVSDDLIDSLEDMLSNNDDETIKDTVLENILRNIIISLTDTDDLELLSKLGSHVNHPIGDILIVKKGLLSDSKENLITIITAMIIFSKDRNSPAIAYLTIKDHMQEDYTNNLDIFIYPILDKLTNVLIEKGLTNA